MKPAALKAEAFKAGATKLSAKDAALLQVGGAVGLYAGAMGLDKVSNKANTAVKAIQDNRARTIVSADQTISRFKNAQSDANYHTATAADIARQAKERKAEAEAYQRVSSPTAYASNYLKQIKSDVKAKIKR